MGSQALGHPAGAAAPGSPQLSAPALPQGGPHSPRRGRGSKAEAKRQSSIHAIISAECPAASQLTSVQSPRKDCSK